MAKFLDVFEDVTKLGTKVPTDEYLDNGDYPIIDQGQAYISGYRNDDTGLFTDIPVIIFGDHTRVLKYVNMPCFLGADGVKLLKSKDETADYKYLYYALCNAKIPNTGYNRHFKWLKEVEIPLPDVKTQKQIASNLDKVTQTIDLCNAILEKLDLLVKARFVEMFGDPNAENLDLKEELIGDNCFVTKLAGFEYTNYIHYADYGDVVMVKAQNVKNGTLNEKELSYITNEVSDSLPRSQLSPGDVVMTYVGANIGDVAIIDDKHKYHLAPNVAKIRPNAEVFNSVFFMYMLMMKTDYIVRNSAETAKAALSMEKIRKLQVFVPLLALQEQFADFVEQTDKSKLAVKQVLEKAETLKKALMQEYFG